MRLSLLGLIVLLGLVGGHARGEDRPNFVVIFCDDMGYGDLSCFGHPTIDTPNLDAMADEGLRATNFYVAASVCTPSRAALLTGRYPIRNGMCGDRRVLFPDSVSGLPAEEITIAEVLSDAGYATAMVGKWHLGHRDEFLPTTQGFDRYYGIPYSNDMDKVKSDDPAKKGRGVFWDPDHRDFNVPLLEGTARDGCEIIERPVDQHTLTRRYTDRAIENIRDMKDRPFFLYLAHSLPHVPLFRSDPFIDHSAAGIYGDVIEEIDHGVGRILQTLRDEGLDRKTMVVFTSDNGPWLVFKHHGGSAGPLREGKGTTFEGGMRVPGIFWMPDTIPAGTRSSNMACTLDLLPTLASMAGADLPDRKLDGHDLGDWLRGVNDSPRNELFYYRNRRLMAVRVGDHKLHYITQNAYAGDTKAKSHDPPLLYDLSIDLREQNDIAADHPDVVERINLARSRFESELDVPASELDRR